MISPELLNLYNAAIRSLPDQRRSVDAQFKEACDDHFKHLTAQLDGCVNALERADLPALREHSRTDRNQPFPPTNEAHAFINAVRELADPEPARVMSPVTPADLALHQAERDRKDAPKIAALLDPIPPMSPPASEPVPAVAEPIPTPAVTPAEPNRKPAKRR